MQPQTSHPQGFYKLRPTHGQRNATSDHVCIKTQTPPSIIPKGVALRLKKPNLAVGYKIHERIGANSHAKDGKEYPK
jgi:hypothetical protein